MNKFLVLFLALLPAISSAQYARWQPLFSTKNVNYFYDSKTIGDDFVWVQYRVAADKTQQLGFSLYKARFAVDCENNKFAVSEASYYRQDGSLVKDDADVVMGDIAVGTLEEAAYNKVCNRIKYPKDAGKIVLLPLAR